MNGWIDLNPFKAWCVQILPTVFDESMSYYECLCKVVEMLNNMLSNLDYLKVTWDSYEENLSAEWVEYQENLTKSFNDLKNYVDNYFNNLDVQNEINTKLDEMAQNGDLSNLLMPYMPSIKVVDTLEQMTNHNTLYILSTDGSIYQWDGTSFVLTNATFPNTDNLLVTKLYGNAESASEDWLNADNLPINTIITKTFSNENEINYPSINFQGSIFTVKGTTNQFRTQYAFSIGNNKQNFFYRTKYANWNEWTEVLNSTQILDLINSVKPITYLSIASAQPDYQNADNLPLNKWTMIRGNENGENYPLPNFTGAILTLGTSNNTWNCQLGIRILNNVCEMYFRTKWQNYVEWKKVATFNDLENAINNLKSIVFKYYNPGTADIQSCDNLPVNTYSMITRWEDGVSPTNYPVDNFTGSIITISNTGNVWVTQIANLITNSKNELFFRNRYSNWSNWVKVKKDEFIPDNNYYMGLGNGFVMGDSITQAISYPTSDNGVIINSWCDIMGRNINGEIEKWAKGGWSTTTFIQSENYNTFMSKKHQWSLVFVGINDIPSTPLETFKTQYKKIVDDILVNNKFVMCVLIPECFKHNNTRSQYNDYIKSLASNKVLIIDLNGYSQQMESRIINGHLNSLGQTVLESAMIKEISKALYNSNYVNSIIDTGAV